MGKNITSTPTSDIQKNLGGLTVDNQYGPKTTAAVQAFQTANGLTADGIFGPKTLAVYDAKYNAPTTNLITTAAPARAQFATNSSDLDNALSLYGANTGSANPNVESNNIVKQIGDQEKSVINDTTSGTASDPYIQALDNLSATSNDSTKALIGTIKAQKAQQQINIDKQYNNYKAGLQLLGIQTNEAQATPDLLMGHIQAAEDEQMQKINDLNTEEAKALTDAESARSDNDFKVLSEKMDYVKGIKAQKADALKQYADILKGQTQDLGQAAQTAQLAAHDIFDMVGTLDDADKEPFLQAISQKYNIPLGTLVTALTDEQNSRQTTTTKNDPVLSPTEAATLGVPYGTTQSQAEAQGITPARYEPKTESPTKTAAQEIKQGQSVLETGKLPDGTKVGNPQGSDGFYDPGVYISLFNSWQGTAKDFVSKYPIVGGVNPASYTKLPAALQSFLPKTAATSNRSS